MKPCADCGESKPLNDFHVNRARSDGRLNHCKPCAQVRRKRNYDRNGHRHNQQKASWARANPEKMETYKRRGAITKHGLTEDQYDEMLRRQGGSCAICKVDSGKRMTIDHDHACCPGKYSCGKCVRGIICTTCNTGLGHFKDDVELLKMAIAYLSDFGFMS